MEYLSANGQYKYDFDNMRFPDLPPHVINAIREEDVRFMKELHTFGPQVIPFASYKPRLKAAADAAVLAGPPQEKNPGA